MALATINVGNNLVLYFLYFDMKGSSFSAISSKLQQFFTEWLKLSRHLCGTGHITRQSQTRPPEGVIVDMTVPYECRTDAFQKARSAKT